MVQFNAKKEYSIHNDTGNYSKFYNKEFDYVIDEYRNMLKNDKNSFVSWILEQYSNGEPISDNLVSTARLALSIDSITAMKIFKYVSNKNNQSKDYIVTTVFSFKGGEADVVYIDESLNKAVINENNRRSVEDIQDKSEISKLDTVEMLLYYVACTRAKHTLINATSLEEPPSYRLKDNGTKLFGDTECIYKGFVMGSLNTYSDFKNMVKKKQNILNRL
jgi:ATP-dependent exoDNAse (exonuclease V) beta subunit